MEARDCADAVMVRCSHKREEFQIILGVRNLGKQGNKQGNDSGTIVTEVTTVTTSTRRRYRVEDPELPMATHTLCM